MYDFPAVLVTLREKVIMDPNYSQEEKELLYDLLTERLVNVLPSTILNYAKV